MIVKVKPQHTVVKRSEGMKDRLIEEFKEHGIKYIDGKDMLQIDKYIFCFKNGFSKALDSTRFCETSLVFDDFKIINDEPNEDLVFLSLSDTVEKHTTGVYINRKTIRS